MFHRCIRLAAAIMLTGAVAHAAPRRIGTIDTARRSVLTGTRSVITGNEQDLGAAPANTQLSSMSLAFNMTTAQQTALDQLTADQQNPSSPRYHQWLTPQTFAAQFGMSDDDLAAASQWLSSQGFTVTGVSKSKNAVWFSGNVSLVENAFSTSVHQVESNGTKHLVLANDLTLPSALAGSVLSVQGIDDLRARPNYNTSTGTHLLVPGDVQTIYNARATLASTIKGTGVKIVVLGQATIDPAYVTTFRSLSGLPAKTVTLKAYTATGTATNDQIESYTDVEWAGAMAPDADLIYATSNNVYISMKDAVDDNLGSVMVFSYGSCESSLSASNVSYVSNLAQQAASQGITVVATAGDAGATGCEVAGAAGPLSATTGLQTSMPATSSYVTAVGGSALNSDSSTYWATTAGSDYSTASGYIPEIAWNNVGSTYHLFASGGGASKNIAKPTWQTGVGVPSNSFRNVPDIALSASAEHPYLVCIPNYCTSGFSNASGTAYSVSGNSVATSTSAGIMALLVQKTGGNIGNVNPNLYTLAAGPLATQIFHDITTGDNKVPCTTGSTDCASGGTIGFTAGTGYDQVTGLGSLNVGALITNYPTSTSGGIAASTTTLTSSATTVIVGATFNLTATVAAATSSTAVPTGTIYFVVNGATISNATLTAGTTGALTFAATAGNGFVTGDNTVSVRYSGDSAYAASASAETHILVTVSAPTFAITPATQALTVASGGTLTQVFTVSTSNGYAGTITFSASSLTTGLLACPTFSPATATLSSSVTSATTTLTLKASSCAAGTNAITTASIAPARQVEAKHGAWLPGVVGGAAMAALLMLAMPRRRMLPKLLAVAMAAAIAGMSGCGSGTTVTIGGTDTTPVTNSPKGTYTVLVKASGLSGTTTTDQFATITLTVN